MTIYERTRRPDIDQCARLRDARGRDAHGTGGRGRDGGRGRARSSGSPTSRRSRPRGSPRMTGAEAGYVTSGAARRPDPRFGGHAGWARPGPHGAPARRRIGGPAEIVVQAAHRNPLRPPRSRVRARGSSSSAGCGQCDGRQRWRRRSGRPRSARSSTARPRPSACRSRTFVATAHAHGLPVLVDASMNLPPRANLRRFIEAGADLVAFSGGKTIRGPQASGFLAGRADLIVLRRAPAAGHGRASGDLVASRARRERRHPARRRSMGSAAR